jgi:hypothetical protein
MQIARITVTRSDAEDLYKVEIEVLAIKEVISSNGIIWRRTSHKSTFISPISPYSNLLAIKLAHSN